jgi:hypothetical protein
VGKEAGDVWLDTSIKESLCIHRWLVGRLTGGWVTLLVPLRDVRAL